MPASLRRGLPGGVGGARNLINSMRFECPPRSGGASLEGREGRKLYQTRYCIAGMVWHCVVRMGLV
eukprot:4062240-Pyramimonas_sp.AAC.1